MWKTVKVPRLLSCLKLSKLSKFSVFWKFFLLSAPSLEFVADNSEKGLKKVLNSVGLIRKVSKLIFSDHHGPWKHKIEKFTDFYENWTSGCLSQVHCVSKISLSVFTDVPSVLI